jgi:hypothetical protein
MSTKEGQFNVIAGKSGIKVRDILEKVYQDAQRPLIFHISLQYYNPFYVLSL